MKLVIADYPDVLGRELEKEVAYLCAGVPDSEIVVHPYVTREAFLQEMADADGLLTAFIPLGKDELSAMFHLKAISINATGYNFVDLEETAKRGIPVCAIGEYCTQEVADHTFALILALDRNLKHYHTDIDTRRRWQYYSAPRPMGLEGQTLGLFGFGKIGRAVARRAQGFGMHVIAVDPYANAEQAAALGVTLTDAATLLRTAHVVSNHMNLTAENKHCFNYACFASMEQHPIFINVGRGGSVMEADLIRALDEGLVRAAGLDVLEAEKPDLQHCALVGRENVILTPHAAFYSVRSMEALQRMSCENLTACLNGSPQDANRVVNGVL